MKLLECYHFLSIHISISFARSMFNFNIMKKVLLLLPLFCAFYAFAQLDMAYYLPKGVTYNADVPTPEAVLGYPPGKWHVSHDQLIFYLRTLASSSDRIRLEEFATTYEGRPLMHLLITSPANHSRLNAIQSEHLKLADPSQSSSLNTNDMPIVIWLGYSIHGNEASGSNAAMLTAYYLASSQGDKIDELLQNAVIIVDPSFNPDGLNRFASWVNTHKSQEINPDPNDREYHEAWPGGRTNHYWFDLNRDWLPLAHPESRGRIKQFHEWKPNILTDHHEMGTNATFFFQPGIPSRKFPWTPNKNVELTHKMAKFHAKYLDKIGSLYYSEESFDDFYVGKGSTYPDVNGSVGILFEQASARGHAQENPYGVLTFPMAIKNHFTTSLSTLASGLTHRKEFLDYQREFYQSASTLASKDPVKAFIFGSEKDPTRNFELVKMLTQHQIEVYELKSSLTVGANTFNPGSAYVVPLNQNQYRLARAIFETRTSFNDSLFYDVSTWTLPLAYNLKYAPIRKEYHANLLGIKITDPKAPSGQLIGAKGAYAYAIEPYGYYAFRAINRLLEKDVVVLLLNETHTDERRTYPRGTMLIPVGVQEDKRNLIETIVDKIVQEDATDVFALNTGLAQDGVDLGSRSNTIIKQPKTAVLVGQGINSYEAGEVWHLLDQRLKMKITLLPLSKVNTANLSRYNRIVIPNGNLSAINEKGKRNLKQWIQNGGVAIAWKNGGKWLSDNNITKVAYFKREEKKEGYRAYEQLDKIRGAQVTGGSIFEAKIDVTHPLGYGLERDNIPLFRNHNLVMKKAKNEYANPIVYTSNPLMSGYVSKENLELFKNSPATTISSIEKGRVITFTDNPNFRAFWYGTNKLFMNALFLGETITHAAGERYE